MKSLVFSFKFFISIGFALILSSRSVGGIPDDLNNINYFNGQFDMISNSLGIFIIEEPLWLIYTATLGSLFGSDLALRVTLFIITFLFLLSLLVISNKSFLFSIAFFTIAPEFAVQMFTNQIRQGFALAIFMASLALFGKVRISGVISAGLIHTSFFLIIPCMIFKIILKESILKSLVLVFLLIFSIYLIQFNIVDINFGRRTATYDFIGALNCKYYIYVFIQYIPLFYLLHKKSDPGDANCTLQLAGIFFITVVLITLVHEAGARLMYIQSALMLYLISINYHSSKGKLAAFYFLFVQLLISINQSLFGNDSDNWINRWNYILFAN